MLPTFLPASLPSFLPSLRASQGWLAGSWSPWLPLGKSLGAAERLWELQRFGMRLHRGVSGKSARGIGITFPKQPWMLWEKAHSGGAATPSCSRGYSRTIEQHDLRGGMSRPALEELPRAQVSRECWELQEQSCSGSCNPPLLTAPWGSRGHGAGSELQRDPEIPQDPCGIQAWRQGKLAGSA